MSRPRKRHVQLSFRKRDKNGQLRGGKRKGAGRPKTGLRSSEPHKQRPRLTGREPVLVTARVSPRTSSLRRRGVYHAIRGALATVLARSNFRVVHFSIQRTHVHFIAEANDQRALSSGVQGLLISAARRIHRELAKETGGRRSGRVFPDRYHERVITAPTQCRNSIRYVLNNFRRHGDDRHGIASTWVVDPFSSAVNFGGWRELADSGQLFGTPVGYERLPTSAPETWLLRIGWARHGAIGASDVPGPQHEI